MYERIRAQEAINKYLNTATRHTFDILFSKFEPFECDVFVKVVHSLKIKPNEYSHSIREGVLLPYAECNSMIQKTIVQEPLNPKYLQSLYANISDCKYAQVTELLCELPQRFSYNRTCDSCNGRGIIKCKDCINGQIKCRKCSGKGRISKIDFSKERNRTYYVDCTSCYGRGKVDCTKCQGHGEVNCSRCDAKGIVTTTTSFDCIIESAYDVSLPKGQYPFDPTRILQKVVKDLHKCGEPIREKLYQEGRYVIEEYKIHIPFGLCEFEVDGKSFIWQLYGKDINIADTQGILEHICSSELEQLKSEAKSLSPFILVRSSKVVKTFLQSPFNEKIFQIFATRSWLEIFKRRDERAQKHLDKACEEIGISSASYARDAILSLNKISQKYCIYSAVWWGICSFILPCLFFAYRYFEQASLESLDWQTFELALSFIYVSMA